MSASCALVFNLRQFAQQLPLLVRVWPIVEAGPARNRRSSLQLLALPLVVFMRRRARPRWRRSLRVGGGSEPSNLYEFQSQTPYRRCLRNAQALIAREGQCLRTESPAGARRKSLAAFYQVRD
jgi:hypothetical protein